MARRRSRRVMHRIRGRFRRGHHSKQGLASKAVNGLGLLIGFNQEISAAWTQVQLGRFDQVAPEVAASFGIMRDGSFNQTQFVNNLTSKVGAVVFVKVAHYLLKHARLKI